MNHLVIGASLKPYRYSNMAIKRLRQYGHNVKAIGLREGVVEDVKIEKGFPVFDDIHTVLLYINPSRQPEYYDYIKSLNPKRVIFNPGTENEVFYEMAQDSGIESIEACSLVMLSTGQY